MALSSLWMNRTCTTNTIIHIVYPNIFHVNTLEQSSIKYYGTVSDFDTLNKIYNHYRVCIRKQSLPYCPYIYLQLWLWRKLRRTKRKVWSKEKYNKMYSGIVSNKALNDFFHKSNAWVNVFVMHSITYIIPCWGKTFW